MTSWSETGLDLLGPRDRRGPRRDVRLRVCVIGCRPNGEPSGGIRAGGRALEFVVGTRRIALPPSARGVTVYGIELSPHMVDQLQRKPGAEAIAVVIGDMAKERLAGSVNLRYVVANSITNLTTQEEQLGVFVNAAAHLAPAWPFCGRTSRPPAPPSPALRDRLDLQYGAGPRGHRDL